MTDVPFQSLSPEDRRDALEVAASLSGRRAQLLEKDIWVVQTLIALIGTRFGAELTFKGGTSLAKAYHAIRRFSEDLDITYDIRVIAPDLVAQSGLDAISCDAQPGAPLDTGYQETAAGLGSGTCVTSH